MPADRDCLFLRAARLEKVARPPVWMMRQAGRYLPEYRAVREKISFLELCRNAEAATEVTLQPMERFGFDAAVIFSDILLPLEGLGAHFQFGNGGPRLDEPFDTVERLDLLAKAEVDVREELPWVHAALRQTRAALDNSKAVLGFAGAPFTLFCYLVEGSGSRQFPKTRALLYNEPEACGAVLARLASMVGEYLVAQVEAGADAVQLFDTWAGLLSPEDYALFALPYAQLALAPLAQLEAPTIYYVNGNPTLLSQQCASGCNVVAVDWRANIAQVKARVPSVLGIQGNLDPLILLGPEALVRARTRALLDSMQDRPGHIVNLGHGVLPPTPIPNVAAFVETVHERG